MESARHGWRKKSIFASDVASDPAPSDRADFAAFTAKPGERLLDCLNPIFELLNRSFVFSADSFGVVIIPFGVSGAGKTTLGRLLAAELGWKFYEGDDFHSQANIDKMHAGVPLTDEDRRPWLDSLRKLIEGCLARKENAVLTCSALRKSYRSRLRVNEEVKFVYLRGSYEMIANQLRQRHGHFMDPELLQSQFATLEEPEAREGVMPIELGRSPRELVDEIKKELNLVGEPQP